jgi:hypothetical protein
MLTGIINTDGELWKINRRFTMRQLHIFGFNPNQIETVILRDVANISDWFKRRIERTEDVLQVNSSFGPAMLSTLWSVATGQKTEDMEDPEISRLMGYVAENLKKRSIGRFYLS